MIDRSMVKPPISYSSAVAGSSSHGNNGDKRGIHPRPPARVGAGAVSAQLPMKAADRVMARQTGQQCIQHGGYPMAMPMAMPPPPPSPPLPVPQPQRQLPPPPPPPPPQPQPKPPSSDAVSASQSQSQSAPKPAPAPAPAPAASTAAAQRLDASTVLANRFVPDSMRALNTYPPFATLLAGRMPHLDVDTAAMYRGLVPPAPCLCQHEKHAHSPTNEAGMMLRKVPAELRYALHAAADSHERTKMDAKAENLRSKKVIYKWRTEILRVEGILATRAVRQAMELDVDDITDRETYKNKFEGLLTTERCEVLRMYEHLSQYNIAVEPLLVDPTGNPSPYLYARMMVPGIADTQPPLTIGDICLIRPTESLNIVVKNQQQQAGQMVYDPNTRKWMPKVIEIQTEVARIVRGRNGYPDEVDVTWISKNDDLLIRNAWAAFSEDRRNKYNVRFIPNPKHYERCLTALDWVCQSYGARPKTKGTGNAQAASDNAPLTSNGDNDSNDLKQSQNCRKNKIWHRNIAEFLLLTDRYGGVNYGMRPEALLLPTYQDGFKFAKAGPDGKAINVKQFGLNDRQTAFVNSVISRTVHPSTETVRPPMILTGPAGTGKTKALLAAIDQILLKPTTRILVCAPSHTAANVITERLGRVLGQKEMLRLMDASRGIQTVPPAVMQFCRQSSQGVFSLPPSKELLKFRVIVCTCSDAHILYRSGVTNASLRNRRRCFKAFVEASLAGCQLSSGGIAGADATQFTHLFIDEATMATEPEMLIPLSVVIDPRPGAVKVEIAFVGDPRQLGPSVYSSKAARGGLSRSLLERFLQRPNNAAASEGDFNRSSANSMKELMEYYNQDQEQSAVFLNVNYRCQPAFIMMPSALFYFDKLQSAYNGRHSDTAYWCDRLRTIEEMKSRVGIEDELAGDISANIPELFRPMKQSRWPVHFRGVVGRDVSVALDNFAGTNSWSNLEEAKEVCDIVTTLLKDGVKPQAIGVISPFRGQVVQIRIMLRKANLYNINVGTIEDFQAVERDVIILSLTRSTHEFIKHDAEQRFGVFGQSKRANVALTRAENLLVVVGNPIVMAQDPVWRQWLWFCLRNGLWYGDAGGSGNAGLELSDEIIYSTTRPMEASGDQNIVTIGTLERISRTHPKN